VILHLRSAIVRACLLTPRPIALLRQNTVAIPILTASTASTANTSRESPDRQQAGVDKQLLFIPRAPVNPRRPRQRSISVSDHCPHQLPRLCCPHAVQCDAFRYLLLQPFPWLPARACLAGHQPVFDTPSTGSWHLRPRHARLANPHFQATAVSRAGTAKTHRMAVEPPILVRGFSYSSLFRHGSHRHAGMLLSERSAHLTRAMGVSDAAGAFPVCV
jgi:hypothetical protein